MGWATYTRSIICIALPILAIVLAVRLPNFGNQFGLKVLRITSRLGRTPRKTLIAFAAASVLFCLLTRLTLYSPTPSIHDEFAYSLTADTFSQGRLSNKTHPFFEHFSSWHIIQSPTYQAKYPPAQGAAMAFGQRLFNDQLIGVWCSFAAAMAALAWACAGWMPQRWAILASLLVLLNIQMSFDWGNSYWGGAMAMLGGSLLVGASGRLRTRAHLIDGLCFGLGLCILAASRPFEGALMALPIGIAALGYSFRHAAIENLKFWAPALSVSFVGVAFLLTYNHSVTGQVFTMPYQVWADQQGDSLNRQLTPSILFTQDTDSKRNVVGTDWRAAELTSWLDRRSEIRIAFTWTKLKHTAFFYHQTILAIPLLALFWPIGNRRIIPLLLALFFVFCGLCTHLSAGHPHYVAGLTPVFAILCVTGLRKLRLKLPNFGKSLVGYILAAWIVIAIMTIASEAIDSPRTHRQDWAQRRSLLSQDLGRQDGKHVVFVGYLQDHSVHQEWVYNSSQIDAQRVIWANDLGVESNRRLVDYYSRRGKPVSGWTLAVSADSEVLAPLNWTK